MRRRSSRAAAASTTTTDFGGLDDFEEDDEFEDEGLDEEDLEGEDAEDEEFERGTNLPDLPGGRPRIDPPVPVPEPQCHELDRLQDAFAREWLFYADDPAHSAEAAALRERELAVLPVNVRPRKLAKLATGQPVWSYSSPGTDAHVIRYVAKRWRIDYQPE